MSKNGLGMPPVQVTILELKGLIRTNLLKKYELLWTQN